jgi:16S rRNA (uracil1498-N3)-methyltransferase
MAAHRFFLTGALRGELLPLTDADLHHAVAVARLKRGEQVVAVEPDGRAFVVQVTGAERSGLRGIVERELPAERLPDVTVFFGMPKGGKAELIVEKCTEIGVSRLVPVLTDRAIARPDEARSERRVERLRRVARSSAAQAQRSSVPLVEGAIGFEAVVGHVSAFDRFLVAWEDEKGRAIAEALSTATMGSRVAVLVGPEGGLAPAEVRALAEAGAVTVSLGPTILRAETATMVATALVAAALRASDRTP